VHICKELVDRLGGESGHEHSWNGAVFSFTLPVFSLATLITPAIQSAAPGQDSIALIVTEVGSRNVYASNELRGELCRRIRELLKRGLRCEYDALLPRNRGADSGRPLLHSAVADEAGGHAIVQRVREQLRRFRQMQGEELQFPCRITFWPLAKVPAAESGQSLIDYGIRIHSGFGKR